MACLLIGSWPTLLAERFILQARCEADLRATCIQKWVNLGKASFSFVISCLLLFLNTSTVSWQRIHCRHAANVQIHHAQQVSPAQWRPDRQVRLCYILHSYTCRPSPRLPQAWWTCLTYYTWSCCLYALSLQAFANTGSDWRVPGMH